MLDGKTRKAINFDLDTKALQEHYPNSWRNAYVSLRNELQLQGFEHRQGSGYVSKKEIAYSQVNRSVHKIKKNLPWLSFCVKKMDVTEIGDTFDLTYLMKVNNKSAQKNTIIETQLGAKVERERRLQK